MSTAIHNGINQSKFETSKDSFLTGIHLSKSKVSAACVTNSLNSFEVSLKDLRRDVVPE